MIAHTPLLGTDNSARTALFSSLLDRLTAQVPGVVHAIAMSSDGLVLAATKSLPADRADQLSAAVAGQVSLANATCAVLDAGVYQYTMQVMAAGTLVIKPAADGTAFAAITRHDGDTGQTAFHLAEIANQLGTAIQPGQRNGG
ncbi:roadblock/LC7 domain-containing protein [Catellatospora sp. NPDC049133]|uniref:roadblock/LC7 domain-containing protein n=1 Tax=Catellatospora sp. NPDC049133 TaxID=3155499 RepID=UPI0033CB871E